MTESILAKRVHLRAGHVAVSERAHHPEFSVDRMGRLQELSGRLLAQRVLALPIGEPIGRVGLTALELANLQLAGIAIDVLLHPGVEARFIEAMGFSNGSSVSRGRQGHRSSLSEGREPITPSPFRSQRSYRIEYRPQGS